MREPSPWSPAIHFQAQPRVAAQARCGGVFTASFLTDLPAAVTCEACISRMAEDVELTLRFEGTCPARPATMGRPRGHEVYMDSNGTVCRACGARLSERP